ncbi:MAG: tRNA adenosine(34) deaminase TadA [Candidatus Aminicenantes bacterium]|nr:MAG: tRNA adenosine(34) deaminase TadA [Candidatus Aminicenantes bacterium]
MKNDEYFMRKALAEAEKSIRKNEIPVGAVLVAEDKILSSAHNETVVRNDPTAHAEIVTIRKACRKRNNYRLPDCDLYITLEPCAMCLGAMVQTRIRRLIYGALDPKAGAVESIMRFPFDKTNHKPDINGGVLAEECGKILKNFFKDKRKQAKRE